MWHLVMTVVGQEDTAGINLISQGFQVYNPVIRIDKRTPKVCKKADKKYDMDYTAMFPGYIFLNAIHGESNLSPIRSTRGVNSRVGLVRFGPYPAVVPENIVLDLKSREDSNGIHQIGKTDYAPGDPVKIVDGPFTGYEAMFKSRDSWERVTILLNGVRELKINHRSVAPAA